MRLPRMRVTICDLLILVAPVAGNCGVLRVLGDRDRISQWEEFLLIFLPLMNVALIGSAIQVARWMRVRRPGEATSGVSASPSALTYFSVHFFLIELLLDVFRPAVLTAYCEAMRWLALDLVGGSWAESARVRPSATSLALEATLIALVCSGPILILAWVGRLLAVRCAATIPHRRFRLMTGLVSFGFAAAALAIVMTPREFADDEGEIALAFKVIDRTSGKPVPTAVLRMTDPFDPNEPSPGALTDAGGRAQLIGRLAVVGARNLFWTVGSASTWGRWLEVSAPGYQTARLALPEVLAPSIALETPVIGAIALARGETPEPPFRDLAGIYSNNRRGYNGVVIKVEPDGRFASLITDSNPIRREYGYLKRGEEEILLDAIPHPGNKSIPMKAPSFRRVKTGDPFHLRTTARGGGVVMDFSRSAFSWKELIIFSHHMILKHRSAFERSRMTLLRLPLTCAF